MSDIDRHDDEIRELLVPFALDQLDAPERARVERALDADPQLRAELDAFHAVGAQIVGGLPRLTAPPALKRRVLDTVAAGASHDGQDIPAAAPVIVNTSPARDRARRRWFAAPAFSGALAAACLVLAVVAVDLGRDLDAAEQRADKLQQRAGAAQGVPAGFEDAQPHTVSTSGEFEDTKGSLIQVSENKWILLFSDVPTPALGKSWQVWTADSRGLIQNVAQWDSGDTQMLVLDRADIKQVMVSYEPTTRPAPVPSRVPVADVKV